VVLRYQEGLTHPEIAEILGLPAGTVKTYLHRARKELAQLLTESGWKTNA
jgi:RNA polymerase sigma-70 factor (ECF subfamily)